MFALTTGPIPVTTGRKVRAKNSNGRAERTCVPPTTVIREVCCETQRGAHSRSLLTRPQEDKTSTGLHGGRSLPVRKVALYL
jgi:hypothetical protein